MYNDWQTDMDKTMPYIDILKEKIFKGSEFRNIEKSDNEILLWLDQYAGIDYIVKNKENSVLGIAARIQYDVDYRTFTIRYKRHTGTDTEFLKRKEAIKKGYFYPAFTLQAYFNSKNKTLLSAGIVSTKYLYNFIEQHPRKSFKEDVG